MDEESLQDRRDLPVFIHSELDDLPLSPNAFRLYCHLARRAGTGTAWPSYQSMGDKCYATLAESGGRRNLAIKAMKELVDLGLIKKELRQDEIKGNKSNVYYLTPRSQWNTPGIAGILGGVFVECQPGIPTIPKGTPSEGTPNDDDDDKASRGDVFKLFENVMPGSLTVFVSETLNDYIDTYGAKEVLSAIEKAGKAKAYSLNYIETVLVNRAAGTDKPQKKEQRSGTYRKADSNSSQHISSAEAEYVMPAKYR
jgi:hypothetical protein